MFVLLPALLTGWVLHFVWAREYEGVDFHRQYWAAGQRVLEGLSPYVLTKAQIAAGMTFANPAATGLLFAPFALLARTPSSALFTALCIASALATLRVLEVRDWRLYGMVLLLGPVVSAWQTSNLTLPLVFGIALAWRWRDRPVFAGLVVALIISFKLFLWPIGLWLIATRRYRASAYAIGLGLLINGLAWAVVGVGQIRPYLHLSSAVVHTARRTGYGLIALALHLGAGVGVATAFMIAVSAVLAVACIAAGRRGHDQTCLLLAIVLMLAASPLVWNHYFALMIVPLAIARPRLGALWALQLILWLCPTVYAATWQQLVAVAVTATTTFILVRWPAPHTIAWPDLQTVRLPGRRRALQTDTLGR